MYNTVKEMHIALDFGLQHIDSNRKQSISPEFKDLALNYAVLQFIESRLSEKSNRRQEGLEETSKRYDDLKDLKKVHTGVCYKGKSGDKVFISTLPFDYYRYISFGANVHYNKFNLPVADNASTLLYQILPFKSGDSQGETYKNLKIEEDRGGDRNDINYNMPNFNLYGKDSKFVAINHLLEVINTTYGVEAYWENYDDIYEPNSFIIINSIPLTLSYDNYAVTSKTKVKSRFKYGDITTSLVPCDVVSSEVAFDIRNTYYYNINAHRKPKLLIRKGYVEIQEGNKFAVSNYAIEYYKKPRLINYLTEQSCEIQVNREIVDLAIQRLKAYIKDEGYQHIVNENQIIE